jgi:hypothetical protein
VTNQPRRIRPRLLLGSLALLLPACGGGSSVVVRPPESKGSTAASTASTTTTSAPIGSRVQQITVTPSTGLGPSQRVRVTGSGFSPNEALVVTQCADKGPGTSQGDCNLAGYAVTSSDANGDVAVDVTIVAGPFGANQIQCGPGQECLVSVSQATLAPTEEADAPIRFG